VSQILAFPGSDRVSSPDADGPAHSVSDALSRVARSLSMLERDVADLWYEAVDSRDSGWSERLAEVSKALHRAALVLETEPTIRLHERWEPT
jgi:hypothetical protein